MSKLICLKDFLRTISAKVIALKPRNTLTAPSTMYVLQIFIFGIETCAIVILQNIKLKKMLLTMSCTLISLQLRKISFNPNIFEK